MTLNIISLSDFRQDKKRQYLQKNRTRIENFVLNFVEQNFGVDFNFIQQLYFEEKVMNNEMAWDYQDLRDELNDAIKAVFGEQIWDEVNRQYWFDRRWISKEEIIENAMSIFVLGQTKRAFG